MLDAVGGMRRLRGAPVPAWIKPWGAGHLILYRTGIGDMRAAEATERILAFIPPPVKLLINSGCAGGLAPALDAGTIVIPDEIISETPGHQRRPTDPCWSAHLRAICLSLGMVADAGPLLTSAVPLLSPAAKKNAFAAHAATAVDMESAAIAVVGRGRGIPTAIVRAILDRADQCAPLTNAVDITPLNRVFYDEFPLCNQSTPAIFVELERQMEQVRLALLAFFRRFAREAGI